MSDDERSEYDASPLEQVNDWELSSRRNGFDWWSSQRLYLQGKPYLVALPRGLTKAIQEEAVRAIKAVGEAEEDAGT